MINYSHYFYLLSLNPFSFLSSFSVFNFIFSLLIFIKFSFFYSAFFGFFNLVFCSLYWWFMYSAEFNLEGKENFLLDQGLKFSMLLFISSEIFFFFSFFWSYFHFFLSPLMELGSSWPSFGVEMFFFLNIPLINTLVLLSSGVSLTISHYFLFNNCFNFYSFFMSLTIFLGLVFTILQSIEYFNSFFSISDSTFGTSFFMLTGFHGVHVLIGTIFLFVVLYRSFNFVLNKSFFLSFELSSWYWHFVDVVWIFLYFILYYMNN